MSLFQLGDFTLHGGARGRWKIDCDALADADVEALAEMVRRLVGSFYTVEGVPPGGLRLAGALIAANDWQSVTGGPQAHLIVDDVLTTGDSMGKAAADWLEAGSRRHMGQVVGAVVFACGPCPPWVKAVFQCPLELWLKPEQ